MADQPKGSPPKKLSVYDTKKIGKGALYAISGALAAFLLGQTDIIEHFTPDSTEGFQDALELGFSAFIATFLNAVVKFTTDTQE